MAASMSGSVEKPSSRILVVAAAAIVVCAGAGIAARAVVQTEAPRAEEIFAGAGESFMQTWPSLPCQARPDESI